MSDKPIIFSGPMIRALVEGRKTQTRRIIKPQPECPQPETNWYADAYNHSDDWCFWGKPGTEVHNKASLPQWKNKFGQPGDLLWVRENWQPIWEKADVPPKSLKAKDGWAISYPATDGIQEWVDNAGEGDLTTACKPSIHLPRWASRLTLEITDVRVQRLQNISEEDSWNEGAPNERNWKCPNDGGSGWNNAKSWFEGLWQYINGPESWDANPWVWALSFKVHKCNIDDFLREKAA